MHRFHFNNHLNLIFLVSFAFSFIFLSNKGIAVNSYLQLFTINNGAVATNNPVVTLTGRVCDNVLIGGFHRATYLAGNFIEDSGSSSLCLIDKTSGTTCSSLNPSYPYEDYGNCEGDNGATRTLTSGEGTKSITISCVGCSNTLTRSIIYDITKPISSITSSPSGWQRAGSFVVTVIDTDERSGLSSCSYRVYSWTGSSWLLTRSGTRTPCSGLSSTSSITVTVGPGSDCRTEGSNFCRVDVWATDRAGNIGDIVSRSFSIDYTPPISTFLYTGTLGNFPWYVTYGSVSLSCFDTASGCSSTTYCIDTTNSCTPATAYTSPVPYGTEGTSYARYFSKDVAGNVETTRSVQFKIDTISPIFQTTISPSTVTIGRTAYFSINMSDTTSGVNNCDLYWRDDDGNDNLIASVTVVPPSSPNQIVNVTFPAYTPIETGLHLTQTRCYDVAGNSDVSSTNVYVRCEVNGVCERGEKQEVCWSDCNTTISINPIYLYPTDYVDLDIKFTDGRYFAGKEVSFLLDYNGTPWNSTNGCALGDYNPIDPLMLPEYITSFSSQDFYGELQTNCTISEGIDVGWHLLNVSPNITKDVLKTILLPSTNTTFYIEPIILFPVEEGLPIGLKGDSYYLTVSWDAIYFYPPDKDIGVRCYLNCPTPDPDIDTLCASYQSCSFKGSTGKHSCTIQYPLYLVQDTNNISCKFYDPENPSLEYLLHPTRTFRAIDFSVSTSPVTITVGQPFNLLLNIKSLGVIITNYTVNISVPLNSALAIISNPFAQTSQLARNEIAAISPIVNLLTSGTTNFRILIKSNLETTSNLNINCNSDSDCSYLNKGYGAYCINNRCWSGYDVSITSGRSNLPEFDLTGFAQIMVLALIVILIKFKFDFKKKN